MAKQFNLTANLQIKGPIGADAVIRSLNSKFKNVSATIDLKLGSTAKDIKRIEADFRRFNTTLAQTTDVATRATTALSGLASSLSTAKFSQVSSQINTAGTSITGLGTSFRKTTKDIDAATFSAAKFGKDSALALKRFAAFTIPTTFFFGITAGFATGLKSAIAFEREMVRVAQTVKQPLGAIAGLQSTITKLSTDLGVSSAKLADISLVLAQAGLSAKETQTVLSSLAKTELSASFENLADTTDGVIAAMRQFKIEASGVEDLLNSINEVSARYAVEAGDIVTAIQKTGGAFKAAGGNVNELIALFSSIRETTRESGDTIATGIRTIAGRLQRTETVTALAELGVELRDASGEFVGIFEAFQRIGAVLSQKSTTSEVFAGIVEQIGGLRQLSRVIPAITEYAKAQEILNVANEKNNSLNQAAARAQESLAVQLDRLRESFVALFREITDNQFFKIVSRGFVDATIGVTKLIDALEPLIPIIGGLALVKIGQGLGSVGQFFKGFAGFFGGEQEISSEEKINAILNERAKIQSKIAKERERAADKERRIIERAKKEELAAIKEKKAAERELDRRRDKSLRLERQNRLDSQRAVETQQKLELEKQKLAARSGAGAREGAAANAAVLQKNTASVIVLTKAIEALTAATAKGTGGAGRTRAGQAGGSSRQVFRDPQTGRIISRGEAQRIGNLTPGSGVIFAGPSGVAGEDIREVRRRDRAERLRRQAETRPLQRSPTLLLPGPTTAPGLQIATGGGFNAIQQANRPQATANFLADQSFKLAEREIASRDFPFGKVVPRTTTAAIRPVTDFERIVSGALDNFKPKRPIRPIPVSVTQGLGFSLSTQASTSAEELNRQADIEAARRTRNARIGRGVGVAAALALPSAIDIFADRERSITQAQNLRVDTGSALASAQRQGLVGALGTGVSAGVGAAFLTGSGPLGAVVGGVSFFSDLIASTERLEKEVIQGRLSNALNAVSDTLKDFENNLASTSDVVKAFQDLSLASNVAINRAADNSTLFGTASSTVSGFANRLPFPIDPTTLAARQFGNTFEGLGFAESIIPAIQGIFGGTQFEDLKRNRRQENDFAIQQAGAASAEAITLQLNNLIKRGVAAGKTDEEIRNDELVQALLSDKGNRIALATTNRAGRRFIAEDNEAAALKVGDAEAKKIQDRQLELQRKLTGVHEKQIKALEVSARALGAFDDRIEELNNKFSAFDLNLANVNARFAGIAGLSGGGSVAGLAAGKINTNLQDAGALGVIRGFLGVGASKRLEQIQGNSGILSEITERLIGLGRGRIGEDATIDKLNFGTDKAPILLEDFLKDLSDVDQARIKSALGTEGAVGEELRKAIDSIRSDAGTGAQSRLESLNANELKLFSDSLNRINDILSTYASNLDTINGILDKNKEIQQRVGEINVSIVKNRAQLKAAQLGVPLDNVFSLQDELDARNSRLGGLAGVPLNEIRNRSFDTLNRIAELQKERSSILANPPANAANRLIGITDELNTLKRNLGDLSDAANVAATDTTELSRVERELSNIVGDRQARENFNRNFAAAGPLDQLKQALGVRTLVGAAQRGSFLNAQEARQGLAAASGLGGAFRINGESLDTIIPRLLKASGLNFLNAGVTDEEVTLNQERNVLLGDQIFALGVLADINVKTADLLNNQNQSTEQLIIAVRQLTDSLNKFNPLTRASGGIIPGSGNSDSVHALLTPGEYVLRKDVVRRVGLGALNRLNGIQRFANGGQVLPGATTNNLVMPNINTQQMLTAVNQFSNSVNILSQSLNNFVPEITFTGHHTVDVRILGAEVLTTIQPAIQELINNQITGSIRKLILDRFPESGPV